MNEPTPRTAPDYLAIGRRSVWILLDACNNDLDATKRLVEDTRKALKDAQIEGSKYVLGMQVALRAVREAHTNVKGLLELVDGDAEAVANTIAQDELERGRPTPRLKHYYQAQRWALDILTRR